MKTEQKCAWLQVADLLDELRRLAKAASTGDEQARDELMNRVKVADSDNLYIGKGLSRAVESMYNEMEEELEEGVDLSEVQRRIDDGDCRQTI